MKLYVRGKKIVLLLKDININWILNSLIYYYLNQKRKKMGWKKKRERKKEK